MWINIKNSKIGKPYGGELCFFSGSSQYDVCVHKPVIIGSGETDLKYGAALWFACCAAQAHESPHHNVFHGQASIFMKLCH